LAQALHQVVQPWCMSVCVRVCLCVLCGRVFALVFVCECARACT